MEKLKAKLILGEGDPSWELKVDFLEYDGNEYVDLDLYSNAYGNCPYCGNIVIDKEEAIVLAKKILEVYDCDCEECESEEERVKDYMCSNRFR